MKLTSEDKRLLEELCQQHDVSAEKVTKLLMIYEESCQ